MGLRIAVIAQSKLELLGEGVSEVSAMLLYSEYRGSSVGESSIEARFFIALPEGGGDLIISFFA